MRRLRQDRRSLDASADMPDMQCDALLRQLAKPSRNQARPPERTPCHRFGRTRRTLALLLSGRCIRRVLIESIILSCCLVWFSGSVSKPSHISNNHEPTRNITNSTGFASKVAPSSSSDLFWLVLVSVIRGSSCFSDKGDDPRSDTN